MQKFVPISPKQVRRRRVVVFGLMIVSTLLATLKWITAIPSDSSLFTQLLMVILFMLTFAWIALFFWSSIFGFFELLRKRNVPGIHWVDENTKLSTRTAILMPVYNESPTNVFANLLAMAEDLKKTEQEKAFDIFVLSDTTNPKVWVEEEKIWLEARQLMSPNINLYYRRRAKNIARKSGNIEDFCNKWGALYDFMIVLDADSLLEISADAPRSRSLRGFYAFVPGYAVFYSCKLGCRFDVSENTPALVAGSLVAFRIAVCDESRSVGISRRYGICHDTAVRTGIPVEYGFSRVESSRGMAVFNSPELHKAHYAACPRACSNVSGETAFRHFRPHGKIPADTCRTPVCVYICIHCAARYPALVPLHYAANASGMVFGCLAHIDISPRDSDILYHCREGIFTGTACDHSCLDIVAGYGDILEPDIRKAPAEERKEAEIPVGGRSQTEIADGMSAAILLRSGNDNRVAFTALFLIYVESQGFPVFSDGYLVRGKFQSEHIPFSRIERRKVPEIQSDFMNRLRLLELHFFRTQIPILIRKSDIPLAKSSRILNVESCSSSLFGMAFPDKNRIFIGWIIQIIVE